MSSPTQLHAYTYTTPGYPPSSIVHRSTQDVKPCASNELLIEVHAAAINPIDIQLANFWLWSWIWGASAREKALGADYSGTIIAAGSQASSSYNVGMPVFGFHMNLMGPSGTLATHITLNPATSVVLPKPASISHQSAAALPLTFLTSYTALVQYGRLSPHSSGDSSVAVLGASGGTGVFGIQIAKKYLKASTVVGTCSQKNEQFVRELGADEVIDYTKEPVLNGLQRLRPSRGYDVIYDCVGGTELIPHLGKLLSKSGVYVTIVGDKTTRSTLGGALINWWNPQQALRTVLGRTRLGPRYHCIELTTKADFLSPALELLQEDSLVIPIDSTYPFTDQGVEEAFERLDSGRARGKVVIEVIPDVSS